MRVTSIDQLSQPVLGNPVSACYDDFLEHQRCQGSTTSTVRSYEYHLGCFTDFLTSTGVEVVECITPDVIRTHLASLAQKGNRPNTVRGRYRCIKSWLIFLEQQERIAVNPIRKVKTPKVPKVIQPALTEAEVQVITNSLKGSDPYSIRNMALWLTMLDTALRLKEVASIKVGQVDQGGIIKVTGKGRKDRFVRIGTHTLRAVTRWMRLRQGEPQDGLWLGKHGDMTEHGITQLLKRITDTTGVHVHPHKVRRTAALLMLRSGMDLATLSHYMGHESVQTTMLYLALDSTDLARSHAKHSPVDGLL